MTSISDEDRTAAARDRVARLIGAASLEVIPLRGAEAKVSAVPRGTTVTITCSPKFGLDRTVAHTASAVANGYRVVPHLAARMVEDERALRRFVARVVDLGVDELFVIGGDGDEPVGRFSSAVEVLHALQDFDHGVRRIGVGGYPEGHPKIAAARLTEALLAKQVHADYLVSQLCFDGVALLRWLEDVRARGVGLPLRIGLAAPIRTARLVELSLKIGVGQSLRYLTKQHGMVGGLLLGRSYAPENLLHELGERLTSPELGIEGLHVFTFNQVDVTVDWQRRIAGE
ncbi:methylenetetrahydrofolate reductase [Amycolatopsis rhabdoformis]|uniref:Methylenetetrahydrofolate reductase n=1 Tax=Amycolatopsis rhabdoformis TaxID=1448059 RepID=A0ABZ1IIP1_9PSEU|nr:methylenetetrahydrofolate reductase [Amycolatopsis rhabdoformis]WSE33593.1 methylenetetrahydrofolate reductase [Amycolatopsis rhabdoformis]